MIQIKEVLDFLETRKESFEWIGKEDLIIQGFCSLSSIKDFCITWAKSFEKLDGILNEGLDLAVIVCEKPKKDNLAYGNYIFCKEPKRVFFSILSHFFVKERERKIEQDSVVLSDKIGKNVSIGHGCYINSDVEIEDDVIIGNHVSIECPALIGSSSIINSGTIIGTDGFGYYKEKGCYRKVPHFGGVIIGSHVEIGANTCIDRGTLDNTIIEDGVKIDNLCHIAHNVRIGKNSLIIACSLLGGSSTIEEDGYVAPGAVIKNQAVVHRNSVVGMGAVVTQDIPEGKVAAGVPARIIRDNNGRL